MMNLDNDEFRLMKNVKWKMKGFDAIFWGDFYGWILYGKSNRERKKGAGDG